MSAAGPAWREVLQRCVDGIAHLSEIARQWEPDHSTGAERRGWLVAQDACDDAKALLGAPMSTTQEQAPAMVVGGRYNWKSQPERLVYLGKNWSGNGYWHQFEKVDAPGVVWCEVLDAQLSSFECTPVAALAAPPAVKQAAEFVCRVCRGARILPGPSGHPEDSTNCTECENDEASQAADATLPEVPGTEREALTGEQQAAMRRALFRSATVLPDNDVPHEPVEAWFICETRADGTKHYAQAGREHWGEPDLVPLYLGARARLGQGGAPVPHVGADENGCATLEWLNGERKITLYTVSNPHEAILKVWGPTFAHSAFVPVLDAQAVRDAFAWLVASPATPHNQANGQPVSQALRDIATERRRQVDVEGWTTQHDDQHGAGQLAAAAACYAHPDIIDALGMGRLVWPWDSEWWKPRGMRDNLVRAGALIAAEIERLDRASSPVSQSGEPNAN